jgi:hypothetical protein
LLLSKVRFWNYLLQKPEPSNPSKELNSPELEAGPYSTFPSTVLLAGFRRLIEQYELKRSVTEVHSEEAIPSSVMHETMDCASE